MRAFQSALAGAALLAGCAPFEHGHYIADVLYENIAGDPPGTPILFDRYADRRPGGAVDSFYDSVDVGAPYSQPAIYSEPAGCAYDPCGSAPVYSEPVYTAPVYSEPAVVHHEPTYVAAPTYAPATVHHGEYIPTSARVDHSYTNVIEPASLHGPSYEKGGHYTGEVITHDHGGYDTAQHTHSASDQGNYVSIDSGYVEPANVIAPVETALPIRRPEYVHTVEAAPTVHQVIDNPPPVPANHYIAQAPAPIVEQLPAPVVTATSSAAPLQAPPVHIQAPTVQYNAPPVYAPGFGAQPFPQFAGGYGGYPPAPGYGYGVAPANFGAPAFGYGASGYGFPQQGYGYPAPANLGMGGGSGCVTLCGGANIY